MKKRTIVLLMAAVMLLGVVTGGTVAWLTTQSGPVTNTFTIGDINIELWEHNLQEDGSLGNTKVIQNDYDIIPGVDYNKDPFVIVKGESEAHWLFIEITEENNTFGDPEQKYITYSVDTSVWTALDAVNYPGVYYRDESATATDVEHSILLNNEVTVNSTITKDNIPEDGDEPQIIFKAYAVQKEAATNAASAWGLAKQN